MANRAAGLVGVLLGALTYLVWEVHDRVRARLEGEQMACLRCSICAINYPWVPLKYGVCLKCGSLTQWGTAPPNISAAEAAQLKEPEPTPEPVVVGEPRPLTPDEMVELNADIDRAERLWRQSGGRYGIGDIVYDWHRGEGVA